MSVSIDDKDEALQIIVIQQEKLCFRYILVWRLLHHTFFKYVTETNTNESVDFSI